MPTDTLLNGIDYFDYAEPDEILKEFQKMIYEQTFIKRTNNTNIVRDLFDNHNEVLEKFFLIKDQDKYLMSRLRIL
jgi:hypothetical protein